MNGLKRAWLLAVAIIFTGWIATADAAPNNPANTLDQIGEAVDNGDLAAFEELVDVDGIVDQALDKFLQEIRKPEYSSSLPPLMAMMFSQAAAQGQAGENLRALLRGEAAAFARNGVSSGAFAGKKLSATQRSGLLAPLFASASIGRKEIRGIGDARRDGADWIVPFSVHDYGNDEDYDIAGRFSQTANGWRMTGLENLDQLFRKIYEESLAR